MEVLDTPAEPEFDDLALLAAHLCGTPISLMSLVDMDRQWYKARVGSESTETPRSISFCAHAILEPHQTLVVEDAPLDPRFADNPLVTGEPRIRFYAGAPMVTSDGFALGTMCVIDKVPRELTEEQERALRVLARHATALLELRLRERSARRLVDHAPDGVVLVDRDGIIGLASTSFAALLGTEPAAVTGHPLEEMLEARTSQMVREQIHRVIDHPGERSRVLTALRRTDGTLSEAEISLIDHPVPGAHLAALVVRDVSDREPLASIAEGDLELLSVLERVSDGLVALDQDWRYVYVNEQGGRMLGRDARDLIGKHIWTEFPDGVGQPFYHAYHKALDEQVFVSLEDYYTPWGRWFENRIYPSPSGISIFFHDITERVLADAERAGLAALIERSVSFVVVIDQDGRVLFLNEAGRELTGVAEPAHDHDGFRFDDFLVPEDATRWRELIPSGVCERGSWAGDLRFRRPGSEDPRIMMINAFGADWTHAGEPSAIAVIGRDVTTQRQLQMEMLQLQKLEGLGRLAGGIAHDFNNLLLVIGTSAELLAATLEDDDLRRADVGRIRTATDRAAELTRQLLVFARKDDGQPQLVELNQQILTIDAILRRLMGERIELVTLLEPGVASVEIDPGRLEQVVVNLAVNARDAMPDDGTLTVSTETATLGNDDPARPPELPPGRYAVLRVTDTGIGMTSEVLEHAFEPFFTTKAPGQGTGLGLSIAFGIVASAGGHIGVESTSGAGTTFTVLLPETLGMVATERPTEHELPRGAERVLLAEDNVQVAELTAQVLMALGYTVEVATTGVDALAVARDQPRRFALLVSDVVMPGLGGVQLVRTLRTEQPDLKVLFISGYLGTAGLEELEDSAPFLPKPFSPTQLAYKVREVLDS